MGMKAEEVEGTVAIEWVSMPRCHPRLLLPSCAASKLARVSCDTEWGLATKEGKRASASAHACQAKSRRNNASFVEQHDAVSVKKGAAPKEYRVFDSKNCGGGAVRGLGLFGPEFGVVWRVSQISSTLNDLE
mmetsp:Transcript_26759/g.67243  ORF Transcript_26759/g.67243 Transcript_26759/m.67243 type:complete len:132 (+) Transcript_26759:470-865(+)